MSHLVISGNVSILSFSSFAYFLSFSGSMSAATFTYIIGNSEKSTSSTSGSFGKSVGKSTLALSTASLTLSLAVVTGTSVVNSTVIMEKS